jgi:hypothetical protein
MALAHRHPRHRCTPRDGRRSPQAATSHPQPSGTRTVSVEVQEWLARMIADRRQPLLYYDHTCRDELVLIIEQARPAT